MRLERIYLRANVARSAAVFRERRKRERERERDPRIFRRVSRFHGRGEGREQDEYFNERR